MPYREPLAFLSRRERGTAGASRPFTSGISSACVHGMIVSHIPQPAISGQGRDSGEGNRGPHGPNFVKFRTRFIHLQGESLHSGAGA